MSIFSEVQKSNIKPEKIKKERPLHFLILSARKEKEFQELLTQTLEPGTLWSVNFPHLEPGAPEPEIVFCSLCTRSLLTEFVKQENGYLYVGDDINCKSDSGTDVDVCLLGNIAIAKYRLW